MPFKGKLWYSSLKTNHLYLIEKDLPVKANELNCLLKQMNYQSAVRVNDRITGQLRLPKNMPSAP